MENVIIIAIIALAVGLGVYSAIKHFKGQSGCCGSAGYRPKKKKLTGVRYQKVFKVEGMHCYRCKNAVEEVVNDIKGIAGKVDLKKGKLTVSYAEEVPDELIRARIERVGYKVTEK